MRAEFAAGGEGRAYRTILSLLLKIYEEDRLQELLLLSSRVPTGPAQLHPDQRGVNIEVVVHKSITQPRGLTPNFVRMGAV